MKITKIGRHFNRKINLQKYGGFQYESAELGSFNEAELEDGEDREKASKTLYQLCKGDVKENINELIKELALKKVEQKTKDRLQEIKDPINHI